MKNLRDDLVHKELSYEIVGVLIEVYKQLGSGHREIYYQRGIVEELKRKGLEFKQQVRVKLFYKEISIGVYVVDFVIDDKVVLEIKKDEYFSAQHIKQVNGYLKALNLQLGILANFTKSGVKSRRILNLY